MSYLSNRKHRVAAVVTAATIALGGGSAAIVAATAPTPAGAAALTSATKATAPASATAARHHKRGAHRRGLLARTDHATFELKAKGKWVTFSLDRGKVTSATPTAISLLRPDGQSVTLQINSATRFRGAASASTVKDGVRASVISENGTARRVTQGVHAKAAATAPATSA